MSKFFKFIIFLNITIIIIFLLLFFQKEITGFINSKLGWNLETGSINVDWVAFWNNDDEKNEQNQVADNQQVTGNTERSYGDPIVETEGTTQDNAQTAVQGNDTGAIDSRLAGLSGNTVIGINYSGMNTDPATLAMHADRIVKVKVKSVQTVAYENVVRAEIIGTVKETYKGEETKEIQIFAFGGTLKTSDLKNGQIKASADKTEQASETVNVLMDFCEDIVEGETYIIFVENNNGVLSPVSGNMSFFKAGWNNVTRLSSDNQEFSMSLGKFEKEYLKKFKE